jgi:hypothetical protein
MVAVLVVDPAAAAAVHTQHWQHQHQHSDACKHHMLLCIAVSSSCTTACCSLAFPNLMHTVHAML